MTAPPIFRPNWLVRVMFGIASTRIGGWFFTTVQPRLDKLCLTLSAGKISIAGLAAPILLLTTKGRKTGLSRQTPLLYLKQGETLVIIGSRGGRARHASWFHNLSTNAHVQALVDSHQNDYLARVTQGAEYQQLWSQFCQLNPGFTKYQSRIKRTIPIVVLEPKPSA